MSKKDYILIAQALANAQGQGWRDCVKEIATVLAVDNPRFNIVTFLKACGAS